MTIDLDWIKQQFSEYTSLDYLNAGGQKSVLLGTHPVDGDIVLKLCHPQVRTERIIREVQAVQEISSTRVPKIFELGTKNSPIGELIWIREERVSGKNLRQILREQNSLALEKVLCLGLHILEALADAESTRIVHRDVKPENIIIDPSGDAWLLDFGLARHLDMESITATSDYLGVFTPGYAPPEQFRNRKGNIDARADLFALGVTLYECAEGVNPFNFQVRDYSEALRRVESQPLPPISKVADQAGQLRDLVLTMTRSRPDHRPSTVAEALSWMQEICIAEGIS
ncbi:serine/threonine protein kinase [Trichocoleus desertorum AS-A10]|uniref:serine/threonine-protein kinase n=1 Tax=Trichocoleus desertorum TaxID=1481672 RepID=UPI003297D5E8